MLEIVRLARFLVVLGFLLYACKLDLESRIVPNRVWKYTLLIALPITLIELVIAKYSLVVLTLAALQILMIVALAYLLYAIGAYGGADAKAIMLLAILFPVYPTFDDLPILSTGFGSFAFSVLANSVIAAPLLLVFMLIRNIARYGVKCMRGNLLYYFIGYKAKVSDIPQFHNLLEYINDRGEFVRSKRAVEPDDKMIRRLKKMGIEEVWVTPALPFLVFITAGYVVAFIAGDLLFTIISYLSRML